MSNAVALPNRKSYRFFTPTPTRWADADVLGHINNAMLIRFIESGRVDYCEKVCGISLMPSLTSGFVIAKLEISFLKQVHHPAALEVGTRVMRLGNSSFDIDAGLFLPGEDQPVLNAKGIGVWMDFSRNISVRLPDDIRQAMIDFEEGELL